MNNKSLLSSFVIFALGGTVGYSTTFLAQQPDDTVDGQINDDKYMSITADPMGAVAVNEKVKLAVGTDSQLLGATQDVPSALADEDAALGASAEKNDVNRPHQVEQFVVHILNDELKKEIVSELVASIANVTASDGTDLEIQANTELKFLSEIEQNPELIEPLLLSYAELTDLETKELLGSLLTASGDFRVEEHALNSALNSGPEMQTQWLELLSGTGVKSSETRDQLLQSIGGFSEPYSVALALKAITYSPMGSEEKWQVIDQLQQYASDQNTEIKIAGIEALSRWVDKGESGFIEVAMNDQSLYVRQAAVHAASNAGIQSSAIKSDLIRIIGDEDESFTLRMDAYDALSNYSLQNDEYETLHLFHKEIESLNEDAGQTKG